MPDSSDLNADLAVPPNSPPVFAAMADYRALAELISDAVIAHEDGKIVDCNRVAVDLLGAKSTEALTGISAADIIVRSESQDMGVGKEDPLGREPAGPTQSQLRRCDGSLLSVEISSTTVEISGRLVDLILVRDAANRITIEAALSDSEAKYRAVTENAGDAIFIWAPDGELIDANGRAALSLGYTQSELLSLRVNDFQVKLNPVELERYTASVLAGETITLEGLHRRRDGTIFPVEVRGSRLVVSGRECILSLARDISERKIAEQAILSGYREDSVRSKERFEFLSDSMAVRFWETDSDHRLTFVSHGQLAMDADTNSSATFEDYLGRPIWDREGIDPDSPEWQAHRAVLARHESIKEFRFVRTGPTGIESHLVLRGEPTYDEANEFTGYRGTIIDETAQFEALAQAEDLEQKFFHSMENIAEGFTLWDSEDRFVACNSHFLQSRPDLMDILIPGVRYEDVLRHQALAGHFDLGDVTVSDWVAEVTAQHRENSEPYEMARGDRWYRVRNQSLADGSILSFLLDITELKARENQLRESEERFRSAFENSAVGMALVSPEGNHVIVNSALADLLGYTPDELAGRPILDMTHPDDREMTDQTRRDMFAGDHDGSTVEKRYIRRDGGEIWATTTVSVVRDGKGVPASAVVQIQDITARREAETALRESEETARAFIDAVFDTALLLELDGTVVAMNAAASERLDKPASDVIGIKIFNHIFSPNLAEARRKSFDQVRRTGEPIRDRISLSGHRWLSANIHPVFDDQRRVHRIAVFTRDITEQKNTEEALREGEATLRAFLNAAQDVAFLIEHDGTIAAMNMAAEHRLQRPASEAVGTVVYGYFSDEEVALRRPLVEEVFDCGEPRQHIAKIAGQWIDASIHPVVNAAGEVTRVAVFARDITEHRNAEEALRTSEERFRGTFEQSSVCMALGGHDGRFLLINQALCDFLGYRRDELVGMNLRNITHAEDIEETQRVRQTVLNDEINSVSWEKRYVRKDGRTVWGHTTLSLVRGVEGRSNEIVGVIQDITQRKEAEAALRASEDRFRGIFEKSAIGMVSAGTDGRLSIGNEAFSEFIGYTPSEFSWLTIADLTHPDDVDATTTSRNQLLRGEIDRAVLDKRYIRRDGEIVWGRTSLSAVYDDKQQPIEILAAIQDITDQKAAEESLRQAQKMEVVGQLTGGIAHDFNNLLAAILGNLELIGKSIDPDSSAMLRVDRAIQSAKTGGVLTNRLLAFSRRQTLDPQSIDVANLVNGMADMLRRSLGETVRVETEFDEGLHPMLVDHNQLENAILNLAINARDAMPRGGTVKISGFNKLIDAEFASQRTEVQPGEYVVLRVADTGQGVAPHILEHVFEPFFTTKDVGEGSGLGLSTVYGFTKQSSGHVEMESEIGKGSIVTMYLPRSRADVGEIGDVETLPPIPKGSGETIFLIEDDPDVRDAAASMLVALEYKVIDGGDGADALDRIADVGGVDLMLTDIVLPGGKTGVDIAATVQAKFPEVRILYMTGYADTSNAIDLDDLGAQQSILHKPFNMRELASKAREMLDIE